MKNIYLFLLNLHKSYLLMSDVWKKQMKFMLFLQREKVPIMKHCFNLEKDLKVKFELSRKNFRASGLDHVVFACPNMSC